MCYLTLRTPSIQTAWSMYHGSIAEGALVNNGKHISVATLVNPLSSLNPIFLISFFVINFAQSMYASTVLFIFAQKIYLFEAEFMY